VPEKRLQRTRAVYDSPEAHQRWLEFIRELYGPIVDKTRAVTDPVTGHTTQVRIPRQFTVHP
jgi:hypothetical protein